MDLNIFPHKMIVCRCDLRQSVTFLDEDEIRDNQIQRCSSGLRYSDEFSDYLLVIFVVYDG